MATEEQLTAEEKAAQSAMEKAFADPSPPATPARDPATGQFQSADKTADAAPAKPEKKPEAKTRPVKEAPEQTPAATPFTVSKEDWDSMTRRLATAEKISGNVGNLQKLVAEMRSATPQGVQIELPPEMEAEYPELAAHLKKAKIKGTAAPATASDAKPSTTDEEIRKLIGETAKSAQKDVDAKLRQARQRIEAEALDDLHPDWRKIVGAGETHDPNNAYRKWVKTQSAEYQKLINETDSAIVIGRSIDRFKAAQKAAPANGAKSAAAVTDRRRAAIQPKGDGGQPSSTANTAEAAMQAAFDS